MEFTQSIDGPRGNLRFYGLFRAGQLLHTLGYEFLQQRESEPSASGLYDLLSRIGIFDGALKGLSREEFRVLETHLDTSWVGFPVNTPFADLGRSKGSNY